MLQKFTAMLRDDEGATMVEYALIVGLIAAVCITAVTALGSKISAKFTSVQTGW
ncbi:MAG: Flp family type IVb pilin [Candidatus Eremiobacteraeota bacterium]|nr:Flp family type IVb pilin [Candidatus Eremiobacteraeota bacterium]